MNINKLFLITLNLLLIINFLSCQTQQGRKSRYSSAADDTSQVKNSTGFENPADQILNGSFNSTCTTEGALCEDKDEDGLALSDELRCGTSDNSNITYSELGVDDATACTTDTDGDGLPDSMEVYCKLDPNAKTDQSQIDACYQALADRESDDQAIGVNLNDPNRDSDQDGLTFAEEELCGYSDNVPNTADEVNLCHDMIGGGVDSSTNFYIEIATDAIARNYAGANIPANKMGNTNFKCGPNQAIVGIKGKSDRVIRSITHYKCVEITKTGEFAEMTDWLALPNGDIAGTQNHNSRVEDFVVDCSAERSNSVLIGLKTHYKRHNVVAVEPYCTGFNTHLNDDIHALSEAAAAGTTLSTGINFYDGEEPVKGPIRGGSLSGFYAGIPRYWDDEGFIGNATDGSRALVLNIFANEAVKTAETKCFSGGEVPVGISVWGKETDNVFGIFEVSDTRERFIHGFQMICSKINVKAEIITENTEETN